MFPLTTNLCKILAKMSKVALISSNTKWRRQYPLNSTFVTCFLWVILSWSKPCVSGIKVLAEEHCIKRELNYNSRKYLILTRINITNSKIIKDAIGNMGDHHLTKYARLCMLFLCLSLIPYVTYLWAIAYI